MTIVVLKWYDRPTNAAIGLALGAGVALLWSALAPANYVADTQHSWHYLSLHGVAINGFLTIFFLGIGIEIARERRHGALRTASHAIAPVVAALSGMAATALFMVLAGIISHTDTLTKSWGVPMATDVAFVVGAMALAGPRMPRELRIVLLALAVVDDAASLVVLTLTGATHPHLLGIASSLAILATLPWLRRRALVSLWAPALAALWGALYWGGLEPALAGAVIGLALPATSTALKVEQWCTRWSALVVLPVFAVCACGVSWRALSTRSVPIATTMVVVRIVGKMVGISGALWLLSRTGRHLAASFTSRQMLGAGALCAMGFTVPLLFVQADFGLASATYGALTLGLLAATVAGGAMGLALLWRRN